MRVLITNGYIVYYFNVVAFKTEIYDDDDDDEGGLGSKFEVALWDPISEASLWCDCHFTMRLCCFGPWFYNAVIPLCFATVVKRCDCYLELWLPLYSVAGIPLMI